MSSILTAGTRIYVGVSRMAREGIANPFYAGSSPVTDSIFHKGCFYDLYDWFLFIKVVFTTFTIVLYVYNNLQIDVDKTSGCVIIHP